MGKITLGGSSHVLMDPSTSGNFNHEDAEDTSKTNSNQEVVFDACHPQALLF